MGARHICGTIVWVAIFMVAPHASAHHPGATPSSGNTGPLNADGLMSPIGPLFNSGIGYRLSYLRESEALTRSYRNPTGDPTANLIAQEIYGRIAATDALAFVANVPLWIRTGPDGAVGLGDIRIGAIVAHCAGHYQGHMIAGLFELSTPTGSVDNGFGHGAISTRALGAYRFAAQGWALTTQLGVGNTWRADVGVTLEYGATALFQAHRRLSFSLGVSGETLLSNYTVDPAAPSADGNAVGDTLLLLIPGADVNLNERLRMRFDARLPITQRRRLQAGASMSIEVRFPR